MKRIVLAAMAAGMVMTASAQTDSTKTGKVDTLRIGSMVIIKKDDGRRDTTHTYKRRGFSFSPRARNNENKDVSTNWWVVDLGFANYHDNTNYSGADAQGMAPGFTSKDQMELRAGKSINVNIWLFMQRVNIYKHVVNLKYGFGTELNNYRFEDEGVRLARNPTMIVLDSVLRANADKNKLAADYLTIPAMLNFNFTPKKDRNYGFSVGVSAGYLYSARQKIKINDDKAKTHNDFDLRKFKLSYIGELSLGPVRLYGSYATRSMWEKGLDQTPYTVGLRLSNW